MRREVEPFRFKKFTVEHSHSTLAVGTDAILLASWVGLSETFKVLDVGTGCGLMALAIAQRLQSNFNIEAIDIDKDSIDEATNNFTNSPWRDNLSAHLADFKDYETSTLDLLICNPPFFRESYKNPELYKTLARHQEEFDFKDLANFAIQSSQSNGRIAFVYPYFDKDYLITTFQKEGWYPKSICTVFSKKTKPKSRILIEFQQRRTSIVNTELIIYKEDNTYTDSYKKLTQPFYLKF